jgi:hypothetical protein
MKCEVQSYHNHHTAFKEGKAMTKRKVLELVPERYSAGVAKG